MATFMKGSLTGKEWGSERRFYDGSLGYKSHIHVPNADDPRQRAVVTAAILNAIHEREAVVIHGEFANRVLYDLVLSAAESAGRTSDIFEIWSDKERPGHPGRPYRSCLQFGAEEQYERLAHALGDCTSARRSWVPRVLFHCMENFLNLMARRGETGIEPKDIPDMLEIDFLRKISGGDFGQMPDHMNFVAEYVRRVPENRLWNDGTVFGMAEHEELVAEVRNVLGRLQTLRCTERGTSLTDVFKRKLVCFVWSDDAGVVDQFVASDLRHAVQRLYIGSRSQDIRSRSLVTVKYPEWFLRRDPDAFQPSLSEICRFARIDAVLPTKDASLLGLATGPNLPIAPDIVRHVGMGVYSVHGSRLNLRNLRPSRLLSFRGKDRTDFRHLLRLKLPAVH